MIYWENADGTFTVPYWLITWEDGSTQTVYDQRLVLDHIDQPDWGSVQIKHAVRYRRPTLGTEVAAR